MRGGSSWYGPRHVLRFFARDGVLVLARVPRLVVGLLVALSALGALVVSPAMAAPVELVSPADSATVATSSPTLSWRLDEYATEPRVEVFDEPPGPGVKPVFRRDAQESAVAAGLSPGVYYWFVRVYDEEDATAYSQVRSFRVVAPPLTRLSVRVGRSRREVRLATSSTDLSRVEVAVFRRGRRVLRDVVSGPGTDATFRLKVNCLRPGSYRYVVTATDDYGGRIVRRGRFRVRRCTIYFAGADNTGRVRPRTIYFGASQRIYGLRWRSWGGRVARGRGTFPFNNCVPYCARGQITPYRVSVRLYKRRYCPSLEGYEYLTLVFAYIGRKPSYAPRRQRVRFDYQC